MFYSVTPTNALRFGDIVRGYVNATPEIKKPFSLGETESYRLTVDQPSFSVVLSPCCSISDKVLLLAPLSQIRPAFLKNPYYAEDLTRINRVMTPQQSLPPETWQNLSEEERIRRLAAGNSSWAHVELFVYAPHDLLPRYKLNKPGGAIDTNYFMIDFRHTFRINCERVIDPKNSPVDSKLLELSLQTRAELREKVAHFYHRVPDEDLIALE
jgi:hypothetical protein